MALQPDSAYSSCEWIEGGIAFNRRSLHTCLIVHHDRGLPKITDFNGGPVDLQQVLAMREEIRAANRAGAGHPDCKGCPHLVKKNWLIPKYPIEIVGIANYSYCNIKCNYCFLQSQPLSSFAAGYKPYSVLAAIKDLIANGALAPHAIIDWGGGEPTFYKEFNELMQLLLAHGTYHYIHTNATKVPDSLRLPSAPRQVHIICSVDAGFPATYLAMKQKDLLDQVFINLKEFIQRGMKVTLKYIVKEENSSDAEVQTFIERAAAIEAKELIVDIDYDYPRPTEKIIRALARLKHGALRQGMQARFGFTGANFAPDANVTAHIETAFVAEQHRAISEFLAERRYAVAESIDLTVANIVRNLEANNAAMAADLKKPTALLRRLAVAFARRIFNQALPSATNAISNAR